MKIWEFVVSVAAVLVGILVWEYFLRSVFVRAAGPSAAGPPTAG
jgi:hypothetical protein